MFEEQLIRELNEASKKYEEEVKQILDKFPGAEKEHLTSSGLEVKPLYTPLDTKDTDFTTEISFPGQFPYTRGVFPAGHRSRKPNIRQFTGVGTAEETNERWKYLISQGATALAVIGLQWCYDSDDERRIGFVGKDELVCDTLYDYETLFDGIDLRKYTIHLITGEPFALANYLAIAEKQGIPFNEIRGSMSNILLPIKGCLDIIEFCAKNVPLFNAGYLDVRNTREGGCTAAQEIAFGIALTMDVVDMLIQRGVDIDQFASRITWYVNSAPEFFEEVAKFRAIRRMWARLFRDHYGAKDPHSWQARMHCQTYAPTFTRVQPFNNLIRGTVYGMAAIMGGVQSLHINSFDEPFAIPTELSAALSVRTQQIINYETGIASVVDPLGGSYYVEWLTDKLEEEAQSIIDTIQSRGGAFKNYEWMKAEVRKAAWDWQKDLDSGKTILVGSNWFVDPDDIQIKAFKAMQQHEGLEALTEYDPTIRDKQIARLNKVRRERDNEKLEKAMKNLSNAIKADENILPPLIEAVKCYMSQGEWSRLWEEATGQPLSSESCFLG